MADTVTQTYSPDNNYERQVQQYRSQVGDNPEAIKQAATQEMVQNNQQLQGAIQQQQGSVSALQQIADFDKQLSQQYSNTMDTRKQQLEQVNQLTTGLGSGQIQDFSVDQINQMIAKPEGGFLSPFTTAGIATGQASGEQSVYDLATTQRRSIENIIGTQAQAYADIATAQLAREQAQQKAEEAEKMRQFEQDIAYAELYGGTVIDPVTGKEYAYEKPKNEEPGQILNQLTVNGKTFKDEVTDGQGSFLDVIRQNPGLSDEEKLALAKTNVDVFGGFQETPEQLVEAGLGWVLNDPSLLLRPEEGYNYLKKLEGDGGSSDSYIGQVMAAGRGDLLDGVPASEMAATAKFLVESGKLEQPVELSDTATRAVDTINEILGSNTQPITDNIRQGLYNPFDKDSQYTAEKVKKLKAILELAESQQMSGQGNLSEGEREILRQAIGALGLTKRGGSTMSDENFRRELQQIKNRLTGIEGQVPQQAPVQMVSPGGSLASEVVKSGFTNAMFPGAGPVYNASRNLLGAFSGNKQSPQEVDQYADVRSQLTQGETLYLSPEGEAMAFMEGEEVPANYQRI